MFFLHLRYNGFGGDRMKTDRLIGIIMTLLQQDQATAPELARQFGVSSIPTLVVMKEGRITNQAMGARPKSQILALL